MGGGRFDSDSYRNYSYTVASKSREEVFKSRKIDPYLDPKDIKFRESCDSDHNPNSTPIIIDVDVTGSMGMLAEHIVKQGLGTLFESIYDRKPVSDPHIMFMANGDVIAGDEAPLQVSQFEADMRIVEQLEKVWLEGKGGGNAFESYNLPWYFAARHTVHDAMKKRGRRGYLFTVGDEEIPGDLEQRHLERVFGKGVQTGVTTKGILKECQRLYNVFHVIIEEGNHARSVGKDRVAKVWGNLLGQHIIPLADHNALAETIVSAIEVAEGRDAAASASAWGGAAAKIVGRAVSSLPKGSPAPKRLGAGVKT